jgi:UDP-3-O-[3-hydroxymyristoyl] glucosamine N-acyltransferase
MSSRSYSLGHLADFLSAKLIGDPEIIIHSIGSLDKAQAGQISFLQNAASYGEYLIHTQASAVLLREEDLLGKNLQGNFVIVSDPYLAYAKISALFDDSPVVAREIHSSVLIGKDCNIGEDVAVEPYVIIGNEVTIESGVTIGAGSIISDKVVIGARCKLHAKVVLYHSVIIGKNALIHSGVVIGSDGFGNANDRSVWHKIHQLGKVVIGDNVEIGANTTIDRGAIDDTVIGNGVKIDNQVQIGHNVCIGDHTAIAGCVGIAGSAKIGKHCMIGGRVGIAGHLEIADGVVLTGMASVGQSITESGIYASAIPAVSHRKWWRILFRLMQLDKLVERVKNLEKKVL